MSDERHDAPSIQQGASAEQILAAMLPLVVRAATDSASAATSAGAAVHGLESRVSALEIAVENCTSETSKLVQLKEKEIIAIKESASALAEGQKERTAWLRQIITPQTIAIILSIVTTGFGLRASLGDGTIQIVQPSPSSQESP